MENYPTEPVTGVRPDDLGWLAGAWRGRRGSDPVEEHWSAPAAGTLMGMFRWRKEDRVSLFEFMTIEPDEDRLLLRIKHFHPGLTGWEEKDEAAEMVLVQSGPRRAAFMQLHKPNPFWLVYVREDDRTLVTYFVREGKMPAEDEHFIYERTA